MKYSLKTYHFGTTSRKHYRTLHPDLRLILLEALKVIDISIIEGIRSDERQQQLFKEGRSKLDGIHKKSKHQGRVYKEVIVSYAVDIIPYLKGQDPFDRTAKNYARFYKMMGIIEGVAFKLYKDGRITHMVRFGLDWDMDQNFTDQTFDDLPHMELVEVK
jgi:peptidoglycan L-alanyl-D-glutamate endopeptidase CwlK